MENYTSSDSSSDSESGQERRRHGATLDLSGLQLDPESVCSRLEAAEAPQLVEHVLLGHNRLTGPLDGSGHWDLALVHFVGLASLDVSGCSLSGLPEALNEITTLVSLTARNNALSNGSLPKSLKGLVALRELNLSGNRLTEFPEQVLELPALRYLYLGGNLISHITQDVWKSQRLQVLSLGSNRLAEVPSTLGQLVSLQALVLCDNELESLPNSIAHLKKLKSLLLHKNRLRTLPTEIITLQCLTELSLRDNPLVVRFVSDMTHDPPKLLELAARVVKANELTYEEENLPRNLIEYLNSGHRCVNPLCKGVFFDNRVEHVKFVDFCGKYRLPLLQYLCSSRCIDPRDADEEPVSGAMIRKVLLG
ncbi:hypothetical protein QAD02_020229 [Eretmocerus hayati]|uniref:Uncharacterized protein n=1 Tax=Eretmocerus hayati TaxID=131215 RepID=A0ACC2PLW5_9HYME|nr:hypothetical protein QAD02_020229 [Eretmocerus hayati]